MSALADYRYDSLAPAHCKTGPSLRRPILKPRKIVVKGALRASLARSLRDPGPRLLPEIHGHLSERRQDPSADH
jgi:hypothetical protein